MNNSNKKKDSWIIFYTFSRWKQTVQADYFRWRYLKMIAWKYLLSNCTLKSFANIFVLRAFWKNCRRITSDDKSVDNGLFRIKYRLILIVVFPLKVRLLSASVSTFRKYKFLNKNSFKLLCLRHQIWFIEHPIAWQGKCLVLIYSFFQFSFSNK